MKKNILHSLVTFIFVMIGTVQAQECCVENNCCVENSHFYAKFLAGVNGLQNNEISDHKCDYNAGYILAGSLGYNWCYGLSLEAEYAFRRNSINHIHFSGNGTSKHGHIQTSSYMGNLIWNVPLCSWGCSIWNVTPFFGAGIGYDLQQMHSSNSRIVFDQNWHHFSWQLMTGLTYPIFCNTEIDLEYKFHQGSNHFYNHSIGIGLTYKFGYF